MKRKERKSPRPSPKRRITHELLAPRRGERLRVGERNSGNNVRRQRGKPMRLGEGDKLKATSVLGDCLNSRGLAQLSGTGSRRVPVPAKGENYCSSGFEIRLHGIGDLQSLNIYSRGSLRI